MKRTVRALERLAQAGAPGSASPARAAAASSGRQRVTPSTSGDRARRTRWPGGDEEAVAISRVTVPDVPPSAVSRAASRMGEELDRREGRNRGKEGEVVAADGAGQSTLKLHGVGAGAELYRMR